MSTKKSTKKATRKAKKTKTSRKKAKKAKPTSSKKKAPVERVVVIRNHPKHKLKHTPHTEQWFVLCSGKEIKNLKELAQDIGEMEDYVFGHHVNDHRNDFVNWIKDVFKDLELAEKVSNHKDKKKIQLVLYEHLVDRLW